MKLLKRLLFSLFFLVLFLVLVSFLLPQKQHVERNIEISASPEKIFSHLADPRLFSEWSPWSKIDPNMKTEFTGAQSGKGAGMSWQSEHPSVGNGSWLITDEIPNESLDVAMDFGDQGGATSSFRLKSSLGKTQVVWGFDTDAGNNPMMRWFGLFIDKIVGAEYAKGLQTLKENIEAGG